MSTPHIYGILETALYCQDVRKTADFYRGLFNFNTLLESERLIALDVAGQSVLLLFKEGETTVPFDTGGGVIPGHSGTGPTHFAFSIAFEDVSRWQQHLISHHVKIESTVNWPSGAHSIYFRDPDHHLAELITEGFWQLAINSSKSKTK